MYRKLIKLLEFQADFKKGEEASLNCCKLSSDNTLLATGGDDCVARVYSLTTGNEFTPDTVPKGEIKPIITLEGHSDPVNCVSFSSDAKLLVTSSSDRSCLIFNVDRNSRTVGQILQKLSFSDGSNDSKNMLMRGCFFSSLDPRYVYTLSTENRQKSYLIKWSNKANYVDKAVLCDPEDVAVVHSNTVTGLCTSASGDKIGIRTSDGWIKVVKTKNMNEVLVS